MRAKSMWAVGVVLLLAATASADQVRLNVALGQAALPAEHKQTTYLKIGVRGFTMAGDAKRAPVNIALVLDKSGSMSGSKIAQLREAAIDAISRLDERDIVSVVAYDHTVSVLVPATRLTDREAVCAAIRRLEAGGNTALFAGVSKGADEVRKFLDRRRVNRVILLSDGLANVGPSSTDELGRLGASLIKEGISVSTLGLGKDYNEDLMAKLAARSDGNHAFIEGSADLARIFKLEFGDVLSVVAQELLIRVQFADGVRPVRALGREVEIAGQTVTALVNQLCSDQEKYILLEVEVPAGAAGKAMNVATVTVTYANMSTHTTDKLTSTVGVRFTDDEAVVKRETNSDVMVDAVEQIATLRNYMALALRDKGKVEEARQILITNNVYLMTNSALYQSEELKKLGKFNRVDAENLDEGKWDKRRKEMRDRGSASQQQRSYDTTK